MTVPSTRQDVVINVNTVIKQAVSFVFIRVPLLLNVSSDFLDRGDTNC